VRVGRRVITTLSSNRPPERFYRGGARITAFRGEPPAGSHEPEDWIGSTTPVFGDEPNGLTLLPDGRLLRDAVEADPVGWLGADHVRRWGSDVQLLVKLLDAGQRLPVHAHPHDDDAAVLGYPHGKAEAWFILAGGMVHLGLVRDIGLDELARLVERQEPDALLALLHAVQVQPGDAVWVPPGLLHAIGQGVLLLEVQQPVDLSVLLEWRDYAIDGARDGHLGAGFDAVLPMVDRRRMDAAALDSLIARGPRTGAVLPTPAERYFRLERHLVDGDLELEPGFAILAVLDGDLVAADRPDAAALQRGSTALVDAAHGPVHLRGAGELLVARPPRP
jgi:mannose-6-phosphate isomerase